MLTILGQDPGIKNYGISIVRMKLSHRRLKYQVAYTGMLNNRIQSLKMFKPEQQAYLAELGELISTYNVSMSIAERFMSRGRFGTHGECISFMLGSFSMQHHVPITLIAAVSWKNACNKHCDLKALYKQCRAQPHELDATLQAMYLGYLHYGITPYTNLNWTKLIRNVENASTLPLKRKRVR